VVYVGAMFHDLGLTEGYRRRSAAPGAWPADSTQCALTVGDRHVGALYSSLPQQC
jgi:hypothetical protein